MQINILRRNSLHVTPSSDTFYNRPLLALTAFWMELGHAEVEPHAGTFSLKAVFAGRERYDFGQRSVWLRPGRTLLVNAEETYASSIDRPSQSLSVFYRRSDVTSAVRVIKSSPEDLLESPYEDGRLPEIAQIALANHPRIQRLLNSLADSMKAVSTGAAENAARESLLATLGQSLGLAPPTALADIAKRSTRDELLSRVLRAREAIYDSRGTVCSLDELAGIACLSKYHFLRVFSDAFGETPMALARRVRLETARQALERGESAHSAARQAGFRNLPAFKRALRRAFGSDAPDYRAR